MTPQHLETHNQLVQALYRIKCANAYSGGPVAYVPADLGARVQEVCDALGLDVLFVITEKEDEVVLKVIK